MPSITPTRRSLKEAGREIRWMRINEGMTPEQMGHKIGVSGRTIRRIEDGARPTVRTMFLISQEFDLEVSELWPVL